MADTKQRGRGRLKGVQGGKGNGPKPKGGSSRNDKPNRGPCARINWLAAFAFYWKLGPEGRSFTAVSEEFGVSDTAVRKHAKAEQWDDKCKALDRETFSRALS